MWLLHSQPHDDATHHSSHAHIAEAARRYEPPAMQA
jgi:hypothetical protein